MNMNAHLPMTPQDFWRLVVRRKWLILGAIALSLGVAATLCVVLPKSYRSSTLILVEDQKIPEDYVKAIIGGNIEERLTMIEQQVRSRTLLSRVIEEFKLYREEIERDGLDGVIEKMRKDITVETVGASGKRGGKSIEAFTISFAHEDSVTAMKVTARIASQFIEENLKIREQLVEGASDFLEQELQAAKVALEAQERAISEFKTKHMGELPQQMEANLRALDRLQSELNATTDMIKSLSERLAVLDKAVAEYQSTGATASAGGSQTGAADPLVLRLRELERALATLSAEYKETYPDIVYTKQEIDKIKTQLAEKYGLEKPSAEANGLQAFDPALQQLLKQRDEVKGELAAMRERQRRLTAQKKEYEQRVESTPAREQELMILIRDYENMQKNYQSLLDKKLNARVAENLEKRQKGEQFRIIDPANVPEKPEKPDRLRILLLGLAAGCAVGFGGALGLERLQPVFRRTEEVESVLGIPLLAAIPRFESAFGGSARCIPAPIGLPSPAANGAGHARNPVLAGQAANGKQRAAWGMLPKWRKSPSATGMPRELNLVSKWRPRSVVAEQFRVAATRLTLLRKTQASTVVVVTSAVKGEGKSAVVVNLGYVLARDLGRSTLIIDCDLKCPAIHEYMGMSAEPGLMDILNDESSREFCLKQAGDAPLWVLTAGRTEDLVELSKVHQLTKILNELRTRFEYIIVDAPPILPLADMHVLADMADVVALVIRAGGTHQGVVQRALSTLRPTSQPCIILTGLEPDIVPYYMREGYDYLLEEKMVKKG